MQASRTRCQISSQTCEQEWLGHIYKPQSSFPTKRSLNIRVQRGSAAPAPVHKSKFDTTAKGSCVKRDQHKYTSKFNKNTPVSAVLIKFVIFP